jgi:hypothetical protein
LIQSLVLSPGSIVTWFWQPQWNHLYGDFREHPENLSYFPRHASRARGGLILAQRLHFGAVTSTDQFTLRIFNEKKSFYNLMTEMEKLAGLPQSDSLHF